MFSILVCPLLQLPFISESLSLVCLRNLEGHLSVLEVGRVPTNHCLILNTLSDVEVWTVGWPVHCSKNARS